MIALGLLNINWCRDRGWITLPANNPYVQSLAGRRRGVMIVLVFDTSGCRNDKADKLYNVSTQFIATITAIRRRDGGYWYRVSIPLKISRMLSPVKDCVKAKVFLEPWLTSRKA